MICRRTTEQFNGCTICLVGETEETLKKFYDIGNGKLVAVPLSKVEIAQKANMSYTNAETKKVYYTQIGDSEVISVSNGYAVTRNHIKTAKGAEKTMIGIWNIESEKDKWFPEWKEEEPIAKAIITSLKECSI